MKGELELFSNTFQLTDVVSRAAGFRGKQFLIAHGTADGECICECGLSLILEFIWHPENKAP